MTSPLPVRIARSLAPVVSLLSSPFLSASGQPAAIPLPAGVERITSIEGITEYRLENGLRVLLFPEPTKATITVNITYMVGSRHEDYGETGMAHLLEHLLFKGSARHPNILQEMQAHGARPNGTTWVDRTNYFETVRATSENLAWALDLEADRMVNSFVARKDLDSEMTVVRNEFEAGENHPEAVLTKRVTATAYLFHNYGKPTIGARSDIERVTIERLQAFYHHFYRPDNAVLVVAGKFDEAEALALVHRYFAPIPRPDHPVRRTYTVEPTQDGERSVTLRRVGDVQAIAVAHHIPAGPDADFPAVHLATMILGDNPSGRLYQALVATGKAASVSARTMQTMDPGLALAYASVRQEKALDEALDAMLATFAEIPTKPFTDEEVERARAQWLKQFELTLNDSERLALSLTGWQAQGDWRLMFLFRDRIREVTTAAVQAAATKYFIPSNRTIGRFIPEKEPFRAEIPEPPDIAALLEGYKGDPVVARGEPFDASPANIDRETRRVDLPGGLKLSLLPKKTRGRQIHALLSFHFGDEHSLFGRSQTGVITAQMLMRGTTRRTRAAIQDELDRRRAQVDVSGGATGVSARITANHENFPAVLALVAEILREPGFPEDEFEQLRQQQLASLESQKSEPSAIASIALQRHLFPYPPGDVRYVATLDERIAELTALTRDDVQNFHRQFYGASNGEVVVIGDFDPAAVQAQLEELFGAWRSPQPYTRVEARYAEVDAHREAFSTPDKANAFWTAAWRVPMNDEHPDYPAMVLTGHLIGSGMNSRLFQRIRSREGLSYGVGASFSARTRDNDALFRAYAICAPENAPKVEAAFLDEMRAILENGFTAAELAAGKSSWLQNRQMARADDERLMYLINAQRHWERTMAFDAELESKVMALEPEELGAALRRHIDLANLSIYRAGDFQKVDVTW